MEKEINKYNIQPKDIRKLKILDWDKLKTKTWHNNAMKKTGSWWCHLEGSNGGGFYGDMDEFWIGFREEDNKINFHFTAGEGMLKYSFKTFYNEKEIENKWDLNVQINALRYLNMLLDEKILKI